MGGLDLGLEVLTGHVTFQYDDSRGRGGLLDQNGGKLGSVDQDGASGLVIVVVDELDGGKGLNVLLVAKNQLTLGRDGVDRWELLVADAGGGRIATVAPILILG